MDKNKLEFNGKSLIKKDNILVDARYELSIPGQRILEPLLSEIHPEDEDFKRYELPLDDLYKLLGVDNQNKRAKADALRKGLDGLQTQLVQFEVKDAEGRLQSISAAWIETTVIKWEEGRVSLRISEALKPFLLLLKDRYYKYRLDEIAKFKRPASKRFLEMCRRFQANSRFNHGEQDGYYVIKKVYSLEILRKMLGVKPGVYTKTPNFRIRIIDAAREEILDKTDCYFEYKIIKTGRWITHFEFIFRGDTIHKIKKIGAVVNPDCVSRNLFSFGVSIAGVNKLLAEYSVEKLSQAVEAAFDYQKSLLKSKREEIKNPDSVIKKALKENWTSLASRGREKEKELSAKQKEEEKTELKEEEILENLRLKKIANRKKNKLQEAKKEKEVKDLAEIQNEAYRTAASKGQFLLDYMLLKKTKAVEDFKEEHKGELIAEIDQQVAGIDYFEDGLDQGWRIFVLFVQKKTAEATKKSKNKFFEKMKKKGMLD